MEMKHKSLIIAVDGHSSTGKSTVARILAARLGYIYIDTGAMYRAVTLEAMRKGFVADGKVNSEGLRNDLQHIRIDFQYNPVRKGCDTYLNGECVEEQIRGMEVSGNVSLIASLDFVRSFLVKQQQEMGTSGGIVMDGRDIGSVVFPAADVKFFMTSSPEVRAQRRYKELKEKGVEVDYNEVEENVRQRDYMDEHREVSPLVRTADAVLIDSSNMTIEQEVEQMLRVVQEKL